MPDLKIKHILTRRGYNPSCPDCRREVDAMTPRDALNLLVAAAATLESRVNRTNVALVQQACNVWLRVNRRQEKHAVTAKRKA